MNDASSSSQEPCSRQLPQSELAIRKAGKNSADNTRLEKRVKDRNYDVSDDGVSPKGGGAYSPPSPYSMSSSSSSPSPSPPPASQSHDSVACATASACNSNSGGNSSSSSSSKRRRKKRGGLEGRKRLHSPPETDSQLTNTTPHSKRRLLALAASLPGEELPLGIPAAAAVPGRSRGDLQVDVEEEEEEEEGGGGNLLGRADEVLARLHSNQYHSLDDFDSCAAEVDASATSNTSNATNNTSSTKQRGSSAHHHQHRPASLDSPNSLSMQHHYHVHALSRQPPGPHISVTSSEGERVYLRLRDAGGGGGRGGGGGGGGGRERMGHKGLLAVPFAEVKASVEEEVRGEGVIRCVVISFHSRGEKRFWSNLRTCYKHFQG